MATETITAGEYRTIALEWRGATATLRLSRPDRLNAINTEMQDELRDALAHLKDEGRARSLVLTGEGRAFCSGADVKEWQESPMEGVDAVRRRVDRMADIPVAITQLPFPVIAGVNGVAAGIGFSLVLACDVVVASEGARFIQAFAQLGLIPDGGSTWFLPRLIGVHRAKELIFTMRPVDAAEGRDLGFVNTIVAPELLTETVAGLADQLASGPTLAYAAAKKLVNAAGDADLESATAGEGLHQALCFASDDAREGIVAFLEKRRPEFRGR
jgi:2-(1,2-epoxy-1,2-dihydrophenyl)acetyl-CoA isomerase